MPDTRSLESQLFVERDRLAVGLSNFKKNVPPVARAEFPDECPGQPSTSVIGVRRQAEDFKLIGKRSAPDQVGRGFAFYFRNFERFLAERPMDLAECRELHCPRPGVVGRDPIADNGFPDDRLWLPFDNKVL